MVTLLLTVVTIAAQVRVVGKGGGKAPIDWSGFSSAKDSASMRFTQTLRSDLNRSGWFSSAAKGRGLYRIIGSCSSQGGKIKVECRVYGTSDKEKHLAQAYSDSANAAVRLAHKVADDIVLALKGYKGIASTRLALIGTASGHKEMYLCGYDGSGLRQLTHDGSVSVAPNWSPDGKKIYYTSYMQHFPDILEIDLPSGKRRVISKKPGLNASATVSPDGKDIALILSKDGNPELYVMKLKSGHLTRLTRTSQGAEASPCWSPDGRQIAYVSDTSGRPQIYIISRAGGAPQRLRLRGSENVSPDWSNNGWITYSSRFGGGYHVFIVNPKTMETRQISSGAANYEDPSWAPDGRHIVCSRAQKYLSGICILDIMGDSPVSLRLGNKKGDWYSPSWSPR